MMALESKMPRTFRTQAVQQMKAIKKSCTDVATALTKHRSCELSVEMANVRRAAGTVLTFGEAAKVAEQASSLAKALLLCNRETDSEAMHALGASLRTQAIELTEAAAQSRADASVEALGEACRTAGSLTERLDRDGCGAEARRIESIMGTLNRMQAGKFVVEVRTTASPGSLDEASFGQDLAAKLAIPVRRTQTSRVSSGDAAPLTARAELHSRLHAAQTGATTYRRPLTVRGRVAMSRPDTARLGNARRGFRTARGENPIATPRSNRHYASSVRV